MGDTTFAYRFMMLNITTTLTHDELVVKQGLRTFRAPLAAIRGLYVNRVGGAQGQQYDELIVSYERPGKAGKPGIVRSSANVGEPYFADLVAALVQLRPEADLRALPRKEALEKLGAADTEKWALVAVLAVVLGIAFVATLPLLVHALDTGHERVTVEELAAGKKLSSRNVTLVGELETEHYLEVTHTKNGRKTSATFTFAVVPLAWDVDDPVHAVLETKELAGSAIDELADAGEYACTLRNVLWEGLSSSDREFFVKTLHLRLTPDVVLCKLKSDRGLSDRGVYFLVMGIVALVLGIVGAAVFVQRRKQQG